MGARKFKNVVFTGCCTLSALIGLGVLFSILYTLVGNGVSGMGMHVFTELTPGPGSPGGLKNAIVAA